MSAEEAETAKFPTHGDHGVFNTEITVITEQIQVLSPADAGRVRRLDRNKAVITSATRVPGRS
jgi:hypothetical protein